MVALPIFVVIFSWALPEHELWAHFSQNLLPNLISSTAILLIGVGVGCSVTWHSIGLFGSDG